jgi:hypothetical protein
MRMCEDDEDGEEGQGEGEGEREEEREEEPEESSLVDVPKQRRKGRRALRESSKSVRSGEGNNNDDDYGDE